MVLFHLMRHIKPWKSPSKSIVTKTRAIMGIEPISTASAPFAQFRAPTCPPGLQWDAMSMICLPSMDTDQYLKPGGSWNPPVQRPVQRPVQKPGGIREVKPGGSSPPVGKPGGSSAGGSGGSPQVKPVEGSERNPGAKPAGRPESKPGGSSGGAAVGSPGGRPIESPQGNPGGDSEGSKGRLGENPIGSPGGKPAGSSGENSKGSAVGKPTGSSEGSKNVNSNDIIIG
ncbi:uncharacterized protein Dyak_GE18848 [Drosophila yakuba]|uniref:Uncharacterized protein n=2 Tax=Drosophila yakuba TaxID=7245 RepID=B4NY46_DROYA|nr:uncharacterized protein Dyak_GE18848 [Drosophila yakuba]